MNTFHLATFQVEVTPPKGFPLCGGWYPRSRGTADPLFATGTILMGDQTPIVLCAVDWAEISNRSYQAWTQALADAVQTTPDRVTVHCMHSHMAPWPDEYAERLVRMEEGDLWVMDAAWCDGALARVADAARTARSRLVPVTHLQTGRARVQKVASNRRILGEDGKIKAVRWTRTYEPEVRAEPEGLIDPWLKTISFWNHGQKLTALHYYAVHPTSYEDALVTPDFTGLARARRQGEDEGVLRLYFTECAGNITAGKYNDGARENRELFTRRIHHAMTKSEEGAQRVPLKSLEWRTTPVALPPREDMIVGDLRAAVSDRTLPNGWRIKAAFMLAFLERGAVPIQIGALHLNEDVCIVHLPGEAFMEYQLFAQQQRPDAFVAVPSYGDCGPGYICLERSFDEGGYEPTDSFVAGCSESILKDAIVRVMKPA